ncbi:hypothetical protein [Sphingomonas sp.]|uniref:hypothetical protein n=1 Tax=Sphingomonas sp. TaxID=28214 RepID=UPI002DD61ADA|nr:hypothetical protein [Sphingomonas sp.]
MIAAILIAILAVCLIVALSARPRRTLIALPVALATVALLVEGAGFQPRGAVVAGLIVALVVATVTRRLPKAPPPPPETIAADRAWDRLYRAGGLLTRGRITAIRRRRDLLVSRGDMVDHFSSFGELRLKLERRVPELIDNYLDEASTAPRLRRQVLMYELLGEVEGLVRRAETVDPAAIARGNRRTALRKHLRSGDEDSLP